MMQNSQQSSSNEQNCKNEQLKHNSSSQQLELNNTSQNKQIDSYQNSSIKQQQQQQNAFFFNLMKEQQASNNNSNKALLNDGKLLPCIPLNINNLNEVFISDWRNSFTNHQHMLAANNAPQNFPNMFTNIPQQYNTLPAANIVQLQNNLANQLYAQQQQQQQQNQLTNGEKGEKHSSPITVPQPPQPNYLQLLANQATSSQQNPPILQLLSSYLTSNPNLAASYQNILNSNHPNGNNNSNEQQSKQDYTTKYLQKPASQAQQQQQQPPPQPNYGPILMSPASTGSSSAVLSSTPSTEPHSPSFQYTPYQNSRDVSKIVSPTSDPKSSSSYTTNFSAASSPSPSPPTSTNTDTTQKQTSINNTEILNLSNLPLPPRMKKTLNESIVSKAQTKFYNTQHSGRVESAAKKRSFTEKRRSNTHANSLNLFERGTLIELSNGKTVPIEKIRENDFFICEKSLYTPPVKHSMFSNISNLSSIQSNGVISEENDVNKLSGSQMGDKSAIKPFSCTFKTLTSLSYLSIKNRHHKEKTGDASLNSNSENSSHRDNKMGSNLKLTSCVVVSYKVYDENASIEFSIDELKTHITMKNVPIEMPLFVRQKGWTSIDPAKTLSRYNLQCEKLAKDDQCMILLDNNGCTVEYSAKMKRNLSDSGIGISGVGCGDASAKDEQSENEDYEKTLIIDDSNSAKMRPDDNNASHKPKQNMKGDSEEDDDEVDEKKLKTNNNKKLRRDFKRVESDAKPNGDDSMIKSENNV